MEELEAVLNFVGWSTSAYFFITTILLLWGMFSGFLPVMFRLGLGLWNRKIVIIATGDELSNLESLLCESGLFKKKNIVRAAGQDQLESISRASVILGFWPDCSEAVDRILQLKGENVPFIFYAPHRGGSIPVEVLQQLETRKHVVISNFRGRLMNDVVTSMITTGYEKG